MPMLSFKVTATEAERIRARARRERRSVSDYLRRSALPKTAAGKIRLVRARHSGALVFQPPGGTEPLSSAQVRTMLAEFP